MRLSLALAVLLVAGALGVHGQPAPVPLQEDSTSTRHLTLVEVLALAEEADTALRAKRAELSAAEGARIDASSLLYNNPQASIERRRRSVPQAGMPGEQRNEWSAGLSQPLEIAGQPGHRRRAAAASLEARKAEIEDLRARARYEAAAQFHRLLAQQNRLRLDEQALRLFESTALAVSKRKAAGEDTRLDANVATVEAERARNQLALAREQLGDAQADLATRLQLPAGIVVEAAGQADSPRTQWTRQELLVSADSVPKLKALAAREDAAAARLSLEQASVYPDITVGINVGREGASDARERLTTLSVSVPLPLFKRNDAGIGQARTELEQARIERATEMRGAQALVATLWAKLQSLAVRVERLRSSVLPALQENESLSLKSQKAGQISVLELIVVNRQTLDARRDLIDAELDLQLTRLALEAAAGWPAERNAP